MEILRFSNITHLAILGNPYIDKTELYRFNKYLTIVNVNDGKVILNGLTRSIVFLYNSEFDNIKNIDEYIFLYTNYFLVPDDFNEFEAAQKIRSSFELPIDDMYLRHPIAFTILPTTRCNARCFYCYEHPMGEKKHMSIETSNKVVDYINSVIYKGNEVELNWFGGEPLFNIKVIDNICTKMGNLGISYHSRMTSNGYLFDKYVIQKAKNLWKLQSVQITLDGTQDVYNKTKNYIYKDDKNPYERILENIFNLLQNDIAVHIRLNVDNYNAADLLKLVHEIHDKFANHPMLAIYCHLIFEDEQFSRTNEEHKLAYEALTKIEDELLSLGYNIGTMPSEEIRYTQCMADNGQSVLINTEGNIGTCEHFINEDFHSHIDNPDTKDVNVLKSWHNYLFTGCENCQLCCECLRPAKCQEESKCDKYIKRNKIKKQEIGLLTFYNNYMSNR